jgi:ketosteroid isomerase-like protein
MADRHDIESLIKELHAARLRGDLAGMCRVFAEDGEFQIVGSSNGQPIEIAENGLRSFRPWLAMLVKTFRLSDYSMLALIIDPPRAAAHWRVQTLSKVTGQTVTTELVDLLEVRSAQIVRYSEYFVRR